MSPEFEAEMRSTMAEILAATKLSAIRSKVLYSVEDVAFLTGFSYMTVYRWINEGRRVGKKLIYLKPALGLVDRGHRIFPDELDDFLSYFPPTRAK